MSAAGGRLLLLGLDGFDPVVGEQLMAEGRLPNLRRLVESSHRFELETGLEKYTGLAWEQLSSGLAPEDSLRWSATSIDTATYRPDQPTTRLTPFTDRLPARTVVFDAPYFDLARRDSAAGMVSWGAHDPGVPQLGSPPGLLEEILERFGAYPATEFIYGFVWPDPERTAEMGRAMVQAVRRRSEIVRWLLTKRLPDWDLGIAVISEYHSATEALWHGWEREHPLHGHASSPAARAGFIEVYEAADALLGTLLDEFPDCPLLAYTPHGMGRNLADVPAMLLLPELLYRRYTGRKAFLPDAEWRIDGGLAAGASFPEHWSQGVIANLEVESPLLDRLLRREPAGGDPSPMDWMPAALYRRAWPGMKAYASPAFYDGRVRVNLRGREARGRVASGRYEAVLDEVTALISECRDPHSGEPIEVEIERRPGDPLQRNDTDADLVVRFLRDYYAFAHPRLGLIGPAPCRRPGGHSGGNGVAYLRGGSGEPADCGLFRTLEVPAAVSAWMGDASAAGPLAEKLRSLAG